MRRGIIVLTVLAFGFAAYGCGSSDDSQAAGPKPLFGGAAGKPGSAAGSGVKAGPGPSVKTGSAKAD